MNSANAGWHSSVGTLFRSSITFTCRLTVAKDSSFRTRFIGGGEGLSCATGGG